MRQQVQVAQHGRAMERLEPGVEIRDVAAGQVRVDRLALRDDAERASLHDTVGRSHEAAVAREAEFARLSEHLTRYHEAAV